MHIVRLGTIVQYFFVSSNQICCILTKTKSKYVSNVFISRLPFIAELNKSECFPSHYSCIPDSSFSEDISKSYKYVGESVMFWKLNGGSHIKGNLRLKRRVVHGWIVVSGDARCIGEGV